MFKRKVVDALLIFTVVFFSKNSFVNAEEVYFTNENGVSMTEKEYNFFSEMYNKNYPKVVTQDIYDMFKDGNYFNGKIKVTHIPKTLNQMLEELFIVQQIRVLEFLHHV